MCDGFLDEDDGRVLGAVTTMSLVSVRTGALPWLRCKAALHANNLPSPTAAAGSTSRVSMEMVWSNFRPGEVAVEKLSCILTMPPTYLITGDAASIEVSLKICIEKKNSQSLPGSRT